MKKHVFLSAWLFCGFLFVGDLIAADGQFILPKQAPKNKKMSKNELKEAIGQEIRDAFTVVTLLGKHSGLCQISACDVEEGLHMHDAAIHNNIGSLQKNLGALHVEIAEVQQKFTLLIERLIDNQKPFKKASRDSLNKTFDILREVCSDLKVQNGHISLLSKRLTSSVKNESGKGTITLVTSLVEATKNAVAAIKDIEVRLNKHEDLKVA